MRHKMTMAILLSLILAFQPILPASARPKSPPPRDQAGGAAVVSAVAAVVSLGIKIAEFFQNQAKKSDLEQISKQLAEIQSKLDEMDKKLDEVLVELRALKVRIDEIPDIESRKRVNALTGVIVKDYSTWVSNPRKYSTEIHATSLNLETETENLMSRKTYGNFETVAFAMFLQRSMFVLLKASPTLQYQHYAAFEQYFRDTGSPDVDGSVGREKKLADARLDEITKYLNPGVDFMCRVSGWYHQCCEPGRICDFYNFQDVGGGMEDGYRLIGSPYKVKSAGPSPYGECNPHGGGDHGQGGGHGHLSVILLEKDELAAPGAEDEEKFATLVAADGANPAGDATPPALPQGTDTTSAYFAGLYSGLVPSNAPEVYGLPGVEACPAQLNPLKSERDALLVKTEGLRQTLPIAAKFQGIAAQLKKDAGADMQFIE